MSPVFNSVLPASLLTIIDDISEAADGLDEHWQHLLMAVCISERSSSGASVRQQ